MSDQWDLLPLGSVITVRGSDHPLVIVGRALMVHTDQGERYFDYGTCLYPEGLMGDAVAYLKAQDITEVLFRGMSDERDREYVAKMGEAVRERGLLSQDESPEGTW